MRGRRLVDQQAEPAERVDALEGLQGAGRDGGARDAVIAVAAGDEIAMQLLLLPVRPEGHARRGAIEIVERDVLGLVDRRATEGLAGCDQVARHFGLAVDGDRLAAAQVFQIEAMERAAESEREAVMDETFVIQAFADAGLVQEVDHALFEHASTDARQHIVGAAPFEDDVVDAGARQELPKQQSRGPGADDGDLRPHCSSLPPAKQRFAPFDPQVDANAFTDVDGMEDSRIVLDKSIVSAPCPAEASPPTGSMANA